MQTILLAVTGISPAILTETIWALAHEKPAIIPDEVVVVTTSRGAADLQTLLLDVPPGWPCPPWQALRKALGRKAAPGSLQLANPRVIELPDPHGGIKRLAEDLRTPSDNAAAADFILEEVRRYTENPGTRIIASIAGGRKTMGALLYASMSLLGRESDRVTHVLVNEPFDQCRDFFFPGQPVKSVAPRAGAPLLAAKARVELADLPFVPLRNLFERQLARRPGGFHALVAEASRTLSEIHRAPAIAADVAARRIEFEGHVLIFSPRHFLLILFLLQRAVEGSPAFADHSSAAEACNKFAQSLSARANPDNWGDWRNDAPKNYQDVDIRKIISSLRQRLRATGSAGLELDRALSSRSELAWHLDPSSITIRQPH